MTTRAARLKTATKQPDMPEIEIKIGKETSVLKSAVLADVIPRCYGLYRDLKAVEPEFKQLKKEIVDEIEPLMLEQGTGSITMLVDGITCKIVTGFEYGIDEENVDEIKGLLADRFADLVRCKTTYKPEMKMLDLIQTGGLPDALRDNVTVKSKAPVFTWGEI